jgi:hypothetical protein
MDQKELYQKEIAKLRKQKLIIMIISYVLLGIFFVFEILSCLGIFEVIVFPFNPFLLSYIGSFFLTGFLVTTIIGNIFINNQIRNKAMFVNDSRRVDVGDVYQDDRINRQANNMNQPTGPSQRDVELLKQYKNLLDQGLISQADYDKKKEEIIG